MGANDRVSQHGVEMTLQAIQGSLTAYRETVEKGLQKLGEDLKEHINKETEWQRTQDKLAATMETIPKRIDVLETKVSEHEAHFQRAKGAVIASRVMYAIIGIILAGAGYLVSHLQRTASAAPRETPAVVVPYPAASTR